MNGKYAVSIDGKVVVWEDGKYSCEDKDIEKRIKIAEIQAKERPFFQINLDGSVLYSGDWIKPSEHWSTSFGFLQDLVGGDLEFIAGDRPTWKKLGMEDDENSVY